MTTQTDPACQNPLAHDTRPHCLGCGCCDTCNPLTCPGLATICPRGRAARPPLDEVKA